MSLFQRAVKVVWQEVTTPKSFVKGKDFESYVRNQLFPKDKYDLLQKTHDYQSNKGDFIENTKEPDFKFKAIGSGKTFFVEAKYRSSYFDGAVEWCKDYQLPRYKKIDRNTPVYIVIGVGQQPSAPNQVFLIPVRQIRYINLFRSFLKPYEVQPDKHIDESKLK